MAAYLTQAPDPPTPTDTSFDIEASPGFEATA